MLFLKPPFHIIEGVAVFSDHANERQFYFLPAMPKLSALPDPDTALDIPQIQLLKFRGNAGTGGFLTFEVNLGINEDQKDSIKRELQRIHELRGEPILAPAILEDGAVRLMILGKETQVPSADGQQPADDDDEEPRFVVNINHPTKPALYGDNQAIFSVELDQDGVQLVEASLLEGELLTAGVVYALDFFALRPAFTVKVSADWSRVQNHFQESFGFDLFFSSVQIDEVVDKLIEDQVIVIEIDSFLPEGEDAGSWVGRRDQAINDFKDMVLDSFFEPSLEPIREEEDGWHKFVHTTERLSLLAATGGFAGSAKFSYTNQDITRIDQKRLNLTMNERVTVKRSIYPQANLKGLGQQLRDLIAEGQVDRKRFIQEVTLDDPWFQRRKVKAHALVDFNHDNVESLLVTLTYGNELRTLRLISGAITGIQEWNSIIVDNTMKRDVEYEYRVGFKNVDTAERPGILYSPKMTTVGDEFELLPRAEELYFVDEIKFGADTLPWNRFPNVSIDVRYDDPENEIRLAETFLLSQSQPEQTWKRFRLNPTLDDYQIKVTYLAVDHRDIEQDWKTSNQERHVIRDPRPSKRSVQVIPAVAWGLVAMIFVEMEYVDETNGIRDQQTLSFFNTDQDRLPKTFTLNLVNPEQRFVTYSAQILLNDNRMIRVPRSATTATSIFIRTDMMGHRIVTVRPAQADFGQLGILRIEADLKYEDGNAGLNFADSFTFWSSAEVHFFEYDYASEESNKYTCKTRTVMANGLVQERDLGMLNGDGLILPTA